MPKALDPALKLAAESMVSKGFTLASIAKQLGLKPAVVKNWNYRNGWTQTIKKSKEAVETTIQTAIGKSLAGASDAVRIGLAGHLQRSVELIAANPPSTAKQALESNAELEPLVRNAKTIFAWAEGQEQGPVNVSFVGQYAEINVVAAPTPSGASGLIGPVIGPVIDVTPVTLTAPAQSSDLNGSNSDTAKPSPVETPDP